MDKIRNEFSAQFANLIAKSETLVADIEKISKWGFKIVSDKNSCTGNADIDRKVISVGRCKLKCRVYILAHEIGHVLNSRDKKLKKVSATRVSQDEYVSAEARDEAKAIRYGIERLKEVYADRPRESHHFDEWSRLAKAGKWKELLRAIKDSDVFDKKEIVTFAEYWGKAYKKELAEARKLRKKRKAKTQS